MMTNCKECKKEMAKGVKKCPSCGKDQRNLFMRHKVIGTIIILAILGAAGNAGKSTSKTTPVTATNTTTSAPVAVKTTPVVPTIKISAIDLENAYNNNAVKADNLYKDKQLQLSGTVSSINTTLGITTVEIETDSTGILTVDCSFSNKTQIAKVANLNKGDNINIIGNCDGKSLDVTLSNCSIK